MPAVMLLFDTPSLLVSSMTNQLKEKENEVFTSELSVKEICEIKKRPDVYIIFADEDLNDNTEALVYLKDRASEDDIPIFVLGDSKEVATLKKTIPSGLIMGIFERPINVKEVVETVDAFLKDESRLTKKKILVVDDSGAMLRNVKGWLEDTYKVVLANSGAMAIKYLALDKPDLVLLDYEMPVIDGKQVLQMIRAEVEFQDIPVIFLTSKGDKQSVLEVMALKPDGYLLKTMPPQDIVRTVDEFFSKQKALNN